jgi:hypothetical protein
MICKENKLEYYDYVNEMLNTNYTKDYCRCIAALDSSGQIKGVIVLHTFVFREKRCDASFASNKTSHWTSKKFFACWIDYVFNELDINRLQIYTPLEIWANILVKMGFTCEAYLQDWHGVGKHVWLLSLLKKDVEYSLLGYMLHKVQEKDNER